MQCLWLYADCRPVRKSMGQPAKHGIGLQFAVALVSTATSSATANATVIFSAINIITCRSYGKGKGCGAGVSSGWQLAKRGKEGCKHALS